jgi:hypothetical protein
MKKSFFALLVVLLVVFVALSFAVAQKDDPGIETDSAAFSDVDRELQGDIASGKEAGQMDEDTDFVNQTGGIGEEIGEELKDESAVDTDD